jgi:eukaryotic-like serine/threonine-protein kinase
MGDDHLGQVLGGKWKVESVLGHGGTSTVYLATDIAGGGKGALKLFHRELAKHPKILKLLLAEARLVAAIDHPGTVKVLDDGVTADSAFIVFEVLVGESLDDLRQSRGGRVPLGEMMPIGDAVMDALSAVHHVGVVHRDLKPSNIHILVGGGVKLLDFGFAKLRGYTADAAQDVVGTASFMPPEQALGLTKKVDARSDVWSLGATLFFCLSGQSVHIGKHLDAMLLASAQVKPRSLADAAPELPSQVVAVVDRALLYPKIERWPDVDAMRAAWKAAHPHWLPSLPPPKFVADPAFLDEADLLDDEPHRGGGGDFFDPRTDLFDSVKPKTPKPAKPSRLPKPPQLPKPKS